jgi:hypothetical protein
VQHCELNVNQVFPGYGKSYIDKKAQAFNDASAYTPFFILRDLDHDADCPQHLIDTLVKHKLEDFIFRIAVRETEVWLLADKANFGSFFGVSRALIPHQLEELEDPKSAVVGIARRSRKRAIRDDMVRETPNGPATGPAYTSRLSEFAGRHWDITEAMQNSDSLRRCVMALEQFRGRHE